MACSVKGRSGLLVDDVAAGGSGALVLEDLDVLQLTPEDAQGGEDGGVIPDGLSGGAFVLGAGLGVDLGERLRAGCGPGALVDGEAGRAAEVGGEEALDDGTAALAHHGGAVEAGVGAEGDADLALAEVEEARVLERGRVARRLGADGVDGRAPAIDQGA
jgi:hypothetical protein